MSEPTDGQAGEPGPPQAGAEGLDGDEGVPEPWPPAGTGTLTAGINVGVPEPCPPAGTGMLVVGDDGEPGAPPGGFPDGEEPGPDGDPGGFPEGVGLLSIGQTVVYNGTTTVVTDPRGQFVTVAGHFVTVPVEVE